MTEFITIVGKKKKNKLWVKNLGHLLKFKHNDILSYSKEDLSSLENAQN